MAHVDGPRCVVVGPVCYLTMMIEPADELQRVHVHPGGQGFWIARMVHTLGCDAVLVAPIGGEAGVALTHLAPTWGVTMRKVLLPLLWPHFLNGWLWVVAHSMRDLTMPLMLMSTGNVVISTALWVQWTLGEVQVASALLILMMGGLLALVLPIQVHTARRTEV